MKGRATNKMVKSKLSVFEEEELAEEVRWYACLYDKTDPGYKDKNRKKNTWKKVEEALGYEEGILRLLSYWTGQTCFIKNGIQSLDVFLLF